MLYISESTDVYENLAMEEILLENWRGERQLVMLYRNTASVVVGAHQNTHKEADEPLMHRRGIRLARRISGGGTVYHDMGNVCFAFFVPGQNPSRLELPQYLAPALNALRQLGLGVETTGRNDILLKGKKISGTASRMKQDCLLFHGTLLYDANLDNLNGVLQPRKGLVCAKGTQSVKSPVINIRTVHNFGETVEFMHTLGQALCPDIAPAAPPLSLQQKARLLAKEKYRTWNWIYGRNPACEWQAVFTGGNQKLFEVKLCINHDIIENSDDSRFSFLQGEKFEEETLQALLQKHGYRIKDT